MTNRIECFRIRVILVEPSHPGNIGASARAMKTMGLSELYLVNPLRFPDPQADWRAAGGLDIVRNAVVTETFDQSIEDCQFVAATSARDRHVPWPVMTPDTFALRVIEEIGSQQQVAVVFGRESNGLTNEELSKCHVHVRIPSHPSNRALNLAMSVQILVYELFQAAALGIEEPVWDRNLATTGEVARLCDHFEAVLDQIEFFPPGSPRHAFVRFQRLISRVALDETEVGLMHGFLRRVEQKVS